MDSTSENDTGVSADDRLTKNQRPTFTLSNIDNSDVVAVEVHISHTIPGGNTPKISTVNATKNNKGQWTFQPKQNWEDGTYQLTVVALDKVGNKSKSDKNENSKVKVEIDTILTLKVEMDTAKENDTGISNTDRLTNNPKPKFNLKFDKDLVELTISIIDSNGQPVGTPKVIKERLKNGELPFSPDQDLLDGKYTIKLDAVDKAGNKTGDQSGDKKPITLSFEIDTYTKKPTIELVEPHPDHGNNTAKSLKPKFKGTAEPGAKVTFWAGGQEIDFIKAVPDSGNREWQPQVPFKNDSTVSLIVKVIDKAGNTRDKNKSAAEETFQLTIPVLEVFPPTVELDASSDSGAKGDFITKETKPVLVITASPNTDVTVKVGNKNYENVKTDNEGKATLTLDNLDLEGGQFTHKFPVEVSIINRWTTNRCSLKTKP
ncbi:Ig-like domain-containing protein [Candidatus Regiella insecticola]|uniref:Ig-like domain-containing protein n=1 Tax=Candidatus Regiella insecticola TaxID=138073 RepID=UPI0005868FE8|nr:Ig-like domain-containing protein [Candidatus Regiella insecticola]